MGESLVIQNQVAEVKTRTERRAGELLRDMEKHAGQLLRGAMGPREQAATLDDMGISKNQSSRWQTIASIPEDEFESSIELIKVADKELTSAEFLDFGKYLLRIREREDKREEAVAAANRVPSDEWVRIETGDFRTVLQDIPDDSVDLILTDPPYAKESLPLWDDMGKFAARVLKSGRLLVAMSGHFYVPTVLRNLEKSLTYVWIATMALGGVPNTVYPYWLKSYGKPLLLFSKGKYDPIPDHWFKDLVDGDGMNKDNRPHQQGVSQSRHLIETLTREGDLVADPFLGSGTNALAAKSLGRRFTGADIDVHATSEAKRRIAEAPQPVLKTEIKPVRTIIGYRGDAWGSSLLYVANLDIELSGYEVNDGD
jgi:hypothetical protein